MHGMAELDPAIRDRIDSAGTYRRDEGQTFLTHPGVRCRTVYSSDEYADWLSHRLPTEFPYARSIGQFWIDYREAASQTRNAYPFNTGYHIMLGVIGVELLVLELALKGVYENTIGRVSMMTQATR